MTASAAIETISTEIVVTYDQTLAREALTYVNELRTGDQAWYWDDDDETKIDLSGTLDEYEWGYDLESVAMLRAAELAINYSHDRPNGKSWYTAGATSAECIAAGYQTAEAVINAWAEWNAYYSGQGHRRAMLGNYGCGCYRLCCL